MQHKSLVADPQQVDVVRNLKVPEKMVNSQALRDYLVSNADNGISRFPAAAQAAGRSQLEVIGVLRNLESRTQNVKEACRDSATPDTLGPLTRLLCRQQIAEADTQCPGDSCQLIDREWGMA